MAGKADKLRNRTDVSVGELVRLGATLNRSMNVWVFQDGSMGRFEEAHQNKWVFKSLASHEIRRITDKQR